jgi:hypothetical protein
MDDGRHTSTFTTMENIVVSEGVSLNDTPEEDRGLSLREDVDGRPLESLSEWLQHLELDPLHNRPALGSSAGGTLMRDAIELKRKLYGDGAHSLMRRPEFWAIDSVSNAINFMMIIVTHTCSKREADIFTQSQSAMAERCYEFPDLDLIPILIENYFRHYNDYFPLLHRQTFEYSVANGLHLRNNSFGAVLLAVCAVGARYCDDPRVFLGEGASPTRYAGWYWFEQIR